MNIVYYSTTWLYWWYMAILDEVAAVQRSIRSEPSAWPTYARGHHDYNMKYGTSGGEDEVDISALKWWLVKQRGALQGIDAAEAFVMTGQSAIVAHHSQVLAFVTVIWKEHNNTSPHEPIYATINPMIIKIKHTNSSIIILILMVIISVVAIFTQ